MHGVGAIGLYIGRFTRLLPTAPMYNNFWLLGAFLYPYDMIITHAEFQYLWNI